MKTLLTLLILVAAPLAGQDSRPASRPTRPDADDHRARMKPAEWGKDAPGRAVMRSKVLPITKAPYSRPGKMKHRVKDVDIVIGLASGKTARAYPILMLGGPMREIINDSIEDQPFVVNW